MYNEKILIVDDSSTQASKFKAILEDAGYSADIANDGVEAMNYLNSGNPFPNLILSDIVMPNMDGFELCAKVKKTYNHIPVIILTVHNDEKNLQKAFNAGAVDYLGIPFSKTELFVRINNVLESPKRKTYLEEFIDTMGDGFWVINERGESVDVNSSLLKMLGYSRTEFLEKAPSDVTAEKDLKETSRLIKESFEGKHSRGEIKIIKKNGKELPVSILGSSIKNAQGSVVNGFAIIRDITERKKVEEKLKQAAIEWQNTFDSIVDLVFIQDKDFKIVKANAATYAALKLKPEDLLGKRCFEVLHKSDRPWIDCPLAKTFHDKKPHMGEVFDPNIGIPLLISASPLFDEKGEMIGAVHIARDITKRKEVEKILIQAEKAAALGQFVAGAAHELNNPLAGVIGFSEIIINDLKNKKVNNDRLKHDLEIILKNANRCKKIVSGLLTYRKDSESVFTYTDINQLIDKSIPLEKFKMGIRSIKIIKKYSDNIPQIIADKIQLSRVFTLIMDNAYQSMDGKGLLKIITEKKGDYIDIVFQDTGKGIKKEHLNKIFDPFFTMNKVGVGTGLGLSACFGIITKTHNGKIFGESEGEGKGARVIIKLPIERRRGDVKKN